MTLKPPRLSPSRRQPQAQLSIGVKSRAGVFSLALLLKSDISARLKGDFGGAAGSIANALAAYTGPETDRVLRCIVSLAAGDAERIGHFVEAAKTDYRDVIYWAEYDESDGRVHDFTSPFAA